MDKITNLPHNIQIELVEGCSRMCPFCGIYGIWKNKEDRIIKKMDLSLAKNIAADLGVWFGAKRIEFAMHGEPTLHENILEVISTFREYCQKSQIQITTNAYSILNGKESFIKAAFSNGLNLLVVDTYSHEEKIIDICKKSGIEIVDYYKDGFNCYHYHNHKIKKIVLMKDIGAFTGERAARKILNHAGNVNPKYGLAPIFAPLKKMCSRPFREISIHYDGTIPLCCIDWKHEFVVGKFPEDGTIKEIWFSDMFHYMRAFLSNKDRRFLPCYKCDYNGGFRLGLLPKVSFSNEEEKEMAFEKVIENYQKTKGYAHKNASRKKFFQEDFTGIRSFFKE